MKFFLYTGRKGQTILMKHSRESWDYLRKEQDGDNRCALEEAGEMGLDYGGSFEDGYFWIDDGGDIDTIELKEL